MTKTLTTEQLQDIYEAAVREEATGNPDESGEEAFDLLCLLDNTGGTGATIRKLIDMVRAANREAQPVAYVADCGTIVSDSDPFFDDYKNPQPLYTAPPAPAVPSVTVIPEAATLTNINQLCPLDTNLSQTDFATGWNDCRQYAITNDGVPPVAQGWHSAAQGWNACRAAMPAQPVSQGKLPPHAYRELVNSLRDTAVKYSGTDQLRERLNTALSQFIEPDHPHTRTAVPDFKALAENLVENLVDCGGADEKAVEQYLAFAEKTCRAAMLPAAPGDH